MAATRALRFSDHVTKRNGRLWGRECGWGDNWVVFLGKTPNSYGDSLNPGVQMGTSEFNAGGNPAMD